MKKILIIILMISYLLIIGCRNNDTRMDNNDTPMDNRMDDPIDTVNTDSTRLDSVMENQPVNPID
jgi:uncharacterized protein YcfL